MHTHIHCGATSDPSDDSEWLRSSGRPVEVGIGSHYTVSRVYSRAIFVQDWMNGWMDGIVEIVTLSAIGFADGARRTANCPLPLSNAPYPTFLIITHTYIVPGWRHAHSCFLCRAGTAAIRAQQLEQCVHSTIYATR